MTDLQRCPKCLGVNGQHNELHVRHGNGGGHNESCPRAVSQNPFCRVCGAFGCTKHIGVAS